MIEKNINKRIDILNCLNFNKKCNLKDDGYITIDRLTNIVGTIDLGKWLVQNTRGFAHWVVTDDDLKIYLRDKKIYEILKENNN